MWERFSYYGMRALLVLYMVKYLFEPGRAESVLGYTTMKSALELLVGPLGVQSLASYIYGFYTGLVYLTLALTSASRSISRRVLKAGGVFAMQKYLGRRTLPHASSTAAWAGREFNSSRPTKRLECLSHATGGASLSLSYAEPVAIRQLVRPGRPSVIKLFA